VLPGRAGWSGQEGQRFRRPAARLGLVDDGHLPVGVGQESQPLADVEARADLAASIDFRERADVRSRLTSIRGESPQYGEGWLKMIARLVILPSRRPK
jgi:hypothetical protein